MSGRAWLDLPRSGASTLFSWPLHKKIVYNYSEESVLRLIETEKNKKQKQQFSRLCFGLRLSALKPLWHTFVAYNIADPVMGKETWEKENKSSKWEGETQTSVYKIKYGEEICLQTLKCANHRKKKDPLF